MLGLYLYSLIICHKSCNMLSILNKLALQQNLQKFVTNNVFLDKKVKTQQQNKKINHKNPCRSRELNQDTQSRCVTSAAPSQRRVMIVVKLFNCFDAMGRNVYKQSRICGPHMFNKFIVSVVFLHAWITLFESFSHLRE